MKAWLSVDTSELNRTLREVGDRLGSEKMNIALRHTILDVGRKVKTLSKRQIQTKYHAKSRRIDKAFRRPQYSLNGTISCIVPVVDVRGTIANTGAYRALRRGPGAKVVKSGSTLLPHSRASERVHFYIPSGDLAGHVFVRHRDGRRWTGYQTYKGQRMKNKKRVGSLSHGVGIGVPQMPMTRAAEGIQTEIADYAMQRLLHYQTQILSGVITK